MSYLSAHSLPSPVSVPLEGPDYARMSALQCRSWTDLATKSIDVSSSGPKFGPEPGIKFARVRFALNRRAWSPVWADRSAK